jgi:hypothetical protein
VRIFKVFGVGGDGRSTDVQEIRALSPEEARAAAERMFPHSAMVEVWEASVLIARIGRVKP